MANLHREVARGYRKNKLGAGTPCGEGPRILTSLTPAWNPCWPLVSFPWGGGSSGLLALPTPRQAHSFFRSLQAPFPQRPPLEKQKQPRLGLHAELEVADLSGHLLGRDQRLAS